MEMADLWSPSVEVAGIDIDPVLASWDAASHPAQKKLKNYLERLEVKLGALAPPAPSVYLGIRVALPREATLLAGRDLENYLTPVAHRLRHLPIRVAWAVKGYYAQSRVSLGIAQPIPESVYQEWNSVSICCSGSYASRAWKSRVRESLIAKGTRAARPGAVAMHVRISCAGRVNWVNLWKPFLDSLGPILGDRPRGHAFDPEDDRIVDLAFCLNPARLQRSDSRFDVWWRSLET